MVGLNGGGCRLCNRCKVPVAYCALEIGTLAVGHESIAIGGARKIVDQEDIAVLKFQIGRRNQRIVRRRRPRGAFRIVIPGGSENGAAADVRSLQLCRAAAPLPSLRRRRFAR